MPNKRFDADMSDITADAVKVLAIKADGTVGFVLLGGLFKNIFTNGGNVGIGTTTPSQKLVVSRNGNEGFEVAVEDAINRTVTILSYDRNAGEYRPLKIQSSSFEVLSSMIVSGNITASGSITPGSDKRLKKHVKTLPKALDLLIQLRPVSYMLKSDNAKALGFIADEVRELFPDLILESKGEDKMLAMNYMGLAAPIVSAIQEMHANHLALEAKYNELLARVEALEK